jgi:hypothetical protein
MLRKSETVFTADFRCTRCICSILPLCLLLWPLQAQQVDFNRDVRSILSNNCLLCHGPDEEGLQAGLRLDQRERAIAELESGATAIVPGDPGASELLERVGSQDPDLRMPPADSGKQLSETEIDVLRRWIEQGAHYARHWAYEPPERHHPPAPPAGFESWPRNPIDHFVLHRMLERGLTPSEEADRYALIRRVTLDLTGLPPTVAEADAFAADDDPAAYEKLVDDLLQRPAFGEHWARKWLDLARYADSAGYADDPPRTIWAYRDWVIRAYNNDMPFDQFTIEQLAGDLLPDPTTDQLIATAFHRNTMTNNEGGTQDEEFRNVAVVDRVNTTMAVWMGTTMACAQCHTHKYDPITQEEYFRFFAILNNTEDADRRNESPTVQIFTEEQRQRRRALESQLAELEQVLATPTPQLAASQEIWEQKLRTAPDWRTVVTAAVRRESQLPATIEADGRVFISEPADTDRYTLEIPVGTAVTDVQAAQGNKTLNSLAAIRLETLPDQRLPSGGSGHGGGNFVVTGITAQLVPATAVATEARYVRITNHGAQKILSLAEVQLFQGEQNIAGRGTARQHSTAFNGPATLAIDGNTDGNYTNNSVTHTETVNDPWWELEFPSAQPIDRIVIWNRTDNALHKRLADFTIQLLDDDRNEVWSQAIAEAPNPSVAVSLDGTRLIPLQAAFADYHQQGFEPADVLQNKQGSSDGWAVGGSSDQPHELILAPLAAIPLDMPAILRLTINQQSPHRSHLLGSFRVSVTSDDAAVLRARVPDELLSVIEQPNHGRSSQEANALARFYRAEVAEELTAERTARNAARVELETMKPATSVPVLRELTSRRETRLQYRGNYLDMGDVVEPGVPDVFHALPEVETIDRLALAHWLVDDANPLTARVLANRYWETVFGRGIVATSEEFGSQGEPPTHPALLDWLATELHHNQWNTKALLRLIVTSATYRQTARVNSAVFAADPDNRWLSRGPRVRLSAEMVRDQALFASGLLSQRMFGPPVKPPQPNLGLTAAFGSSTDWNTSNGEDRYRRGLYTTWRRSNPYPSMATFDAPNREVCTIRRNSTNTPLQSLVTLNDPVYVEAAQSLARRALQHSDGLDEQLRFAFRQCLIRPPSADEQRALHDLYRDTRASFSGRVDEAGKLATDPIGPLPDTIAAEDAAAMTLVSNVLLNLDEMFLKR